MRESLALNAANLLFRFTEFLEIIKLRSWLSRGNGSNYLTKRTPLPKRSQYLSPPVGWQSAQATAKTIELKKKERMAGRKREKGQACEKMIIFTVGCSSHKCFK